MSLDVELALRERLQLKEKELNRYFEFSEDKENITISIRKDQTNRFVWLDSNTFFQCKEYVDSLGGSYDKKLRKWTIPLARIMNPKSSQVDKPQFPILLEPKKETTQPQIEEKEYDLALSKQKLGALIPILEDANGNIIDGFHRAEIDPSWPRIMLPKVTDPVQLTLARLASNVCRRNVPAEEKTKLLSNIAELTGWDAKEIAEALGMSYRWVMKYLPDMYKQKPQVGERLTQTTQLAHRAPESQDLRLPFEKESFEKKSITPTIPVKTIDTGFVFECPVCNGKFHILHLDPSGKHKFEEDKVL